MGLNMSLLKSKVPTHCVLHKEAVACKKTSENLKTTLSEVINIISHIKTRPLDSTLFALLCRDVSSEHIEHYF